MRHLSLYISSLLGVSKQIAAHVRSLSSSEAASREQWLEVCAFYCCLNFTTIKFHPLAEQLKITKLLIRTQVQEMIKQELRLVKEVSAEVIPSPAAI